MRPFVALFDGEGMWGRRLAKRKQMILGKTIQGDAAPGEISYGYVSLMGSYLILLGCGWRHNDRRTCWEAGEVVKGQMRMLDGTRGYARQCGA